MLVELRKLYYSINIGSKEATIQVKGLIIKGILVI